ncbi:LOW QUALITY PROTEIN: hypothetical protein NC653_034289 [Populus alba x Populus x berolinensis]|uniref:Secreted protein n=1 Tax=Populus alba x Populus x berolinensis TaxID=444605 RepID=A0AAD6LM74_9ROSI|nr:LOW QUALITY PROTEIN: hypothetical protein NC653_034289 [Populus alba x Populus x berolinensis]
MFKPSNAVAVLVLVLETCDCEAVYCVSNSDSSSISNIFFSREAMMTEERMHRAGRRKLKEGCRDGERLQQRQQHHHKQASFSQLGGGQSVNNTLNQHHHQQNQMVCHHRRAGKCNRFPCPSLHRELPAPPPHSSVNRGGGGAKRGFIGNDSSINPSPVGSPFFNNSRVLLHLKGN